MSKTFLIQTVDGMIVHDFAFYLIEAIKYHSWYYKKDSQYSYILSKTTDRPKLNIHQYRPLTEIIPIGTVEFVLEYLERHYDINGIKPLNIPLELMKPEYLKRWVKYDSNNTTVFNAGDTPIFVKDNTKIKGFTNIIYPNQGYPVGEYMISEFVEIESEWRVFVFNGKLEGLQNYSGDFILFPDVKTIMKMVIDYKSAPKAYTLDVGVNHKGTFVIEVHDFFSCGLYGFSDYKLLPKMFISTWNKLNGENKT